MLKHSQATEVHVNVNEFRGRVEVVVADNGRGFSPSEGTPGRKGNGLENMRQRLAELGGTLEISSRPGQGTELKFTIPLRE